MEKIVILARSNSPFQTVRRDINYIIANLIELGYIVDIYDPKQRILMKINSKQTVDYSIFPSFVYRLKLNILLNILSLIYFSIRNKNKYTIVQINYLREEYLILPRLIKNIGNKFIITLFGSDINKRSFVKNNFTKIFTFATRVIVTNKNIVPVVNSYLKNKTIDSKVEQLMFPQDHFIYYKNFTYANKTESKQKLGLPTNKLIIAIGTNSTANEQHELIIAQIKQLNFISECFFLFNLSNRYNTLNEREKMLIELINNELPSNNFKIYTDFLSYEEMALVRHATDIFINTRKNDQLAASMIESNLSYSYVITGEWLPYDDYTNTIQTKLIKNIQEVNDKIYEIENTNVEQLIKTLEKNKINAKLKYDNNVIEEWMELYSKLIAK